MIKKIVNGKKEECKSNSKGVKKVGDHWVNEGVKIIDSVTCYVPSFIINVLKSLTVEFPSEEFSIFLKFSWNEDKNRIDVGTEYYIPSQTVSGASVDYEEGPPEGFKGIAHKHPNGCTHFSGTDDTYINQNYDLSLLWESNQLREGQLRIETEYGRIKLPLRFVTDKERLPTIEKADLDKIKKRVVYTHVKGYTGNYRHNSKRRGSKTGNTALPQFRGGVVPDRGLLSTDLENVNKQLNNESGWDNYIDEILALMEGEGLDWDGAVMKYNERHHVVKTENEKDPSNLEEIKAKLEKNSTTKLPGAVKAQPACGGGDGLKVIIAGKEKKEN